MRAKRTRKTGSIIRVNKDVIGKKVFNLGREHIGEIQELVIDATEGRVTYAILSCGGFLGIRDKLFAVPWSRLQYDKVEDVFLMKAYKRLLENAPGFDKNNWPDLSDPKRLSEIYVHYESDCNS